MARTFVYFSGKARTSGNFDTGELMQAGRMDIVCNVIIHTFFISNAVRDDVNLHLIFYGSPDPPKHIEINIKTAKGMPETGKEAGSIDISKKDIAGLLKRVLYKYKPGIKNEVFNGIFIEKKSFFNVLDELTEQGKEIYILDAKGQDIREISTKDLENAVFVFGDHEGIPDKELKRLKKQYELVSVGKTTYFASQTVVIVNNELDRRGI